MSQALAPALMSSGADAGDQTADEALRDALSTWPEGIRPVVHWSESQVGRPGHAHSDYIYVRTALQDLFRVSLHGSAALLLVCMPYVAAAA